MDRGGGFGSVGRLANGGAVYQLGHKNRSVRLRPKADIKDIVWNALWISYENLHWLMMKRIMATLCWGAVALTTSCSPSVSIVGCDDAGPPYQYEVKTVDDRYFATLIPLSSARGRQTFFLSETSDPLTSLEALEGGDPAGGIVVFQRKENDLVSEELGLTLVSFAMNDETAKPSFLNPKRGLARFEHDGANYSLVSCDGILSIQFKQDFPALFE